MKNPKLNLMKFGGQNGKAGTYIKNPKYFKGLNSKYLGLCFHLLKNSKN